MNANLIFKLFGLGATVSVLEMILIKADRKDIAFWIAFAAVIISMLWVLPSIKQVIDFITSIFRLY